jgi:hypothetical protein
MTPLSDNLSEVVKVTVVHFNYVGLFGTRTVVEEDFFFNLARQSVHVYDFSGEKVHTLGGALFDYDIQLFLY